MNERKFAEGLQRRGNAARIRETVSQAMRESALQSRPKLVEPIDYETFVIKNKVLLHNDPQRDMLNFPHDDVEVPPRRPTKRMRTVVPTVPESTEEVSSLMVKECLNTYTCQLEAIHFKYQPYSGSYQQLPNSKKKEPLLQHVFEIDAEFEEKEDDTLSRSFATVTKKGWLLKGPDSARENIISFTRQFKRRFFELKQQTDYTYVLEMYKDDKKSEVKGSFFLDIAKDAVKEGYYVKNVGCDGNHITDATVYFTVEIVDRNDDLHVNSSMKWTNLKKGKHCFELRMTEGRPSLFAAESEAEMTDWIITLNKVINAAETGSQISRDSMRDENALTGRPENYKESSTNHPVVKEFLIGSDSDRELTEIQTREKTKVGDQPSPPQLSLLSSSSSSLPHPTSSSTSNTPSPTSESKPSHSDDGHFVKPCGTPVVLRRKKQYCRETDSSLAKLRQESRQNLFGIYPDMRRKVFDEEMEDEEEEEIEVFPRSFAERYLLKLEELRFDLNLNMADEGKGNKKCNPEPFFVTFAIYDASKIGRKISEDFHVDPNDHEIAIMIPPELTAASVGLQNGAINGKEATVGKVDGLDEEKLSNSRKRGIFSISRKHSDIYLVARISKVLQGGLAQSLEPYTKGSDTKTGLRVHRQMKQFCSHIGHYHMPFAWSAKSLDSLGRHGVVEMPLYKHEGSKVSEEELIKTLQDLRKPDKMSRLHVIPGTLKIQLEQLAPDQAWDVTMTSSLVPIKPLAKEPDWLRPALEVEEFVSDVASLCSSFDSYTNNLYVRPMALKYDNQKSFAKARNIACCVELRDSDDESAPPLKRIYAGPGQKCLFTTIARTSVLHHSNVPNFLDEVKLSLPVELTDKHHLLFRFFHVSCEGSKSGGGKKKEGIEMAVGYSWMAILADGRPVTGEKGLPVAAHLPMSYLSHDTLSLSKSSGSDVKWVDGGKLLFRVNLHLVSTVYTQDQHLHNFFTHCQRVESGGSLALQMNNVNKIKMENGDCERSDIPYNLSPDVLKPLLNGVKSLLAVEVPVFVQFLPTLLNQLFHLLARMVEEDVAVNTVKVLIHIVSEVHQAEKQESLEKYVKYIFRPPKVTKGDKNQRTVHEELAKHLNSILLPANADPLVVTRFLKHAWFIFQVLLKSMTLYLIDKERVKMPRNERFTAECQYRLQSLVGVVTLHIIQKAKDQREETRNANQSLATFIKDCFTLMDRGYVFKLVYKYMENFNPGDSKYLHDFKFEFLRIVCSHEHFIPLSLPLMRRGMVKNFKGLGLGDLNNDDDLKHDYCLSDEFRKHHFLVGLLLFELKQAMSEQRTVRRSAITVLRNQLAKHSFDDRYASKSQQGRIAALYLPLIGVFLDSKNQLLQLPPANNANKTSSSNQQTANSTSHVQNGEVHYRSEVTKSTSLSKGQSSPAINISGSTPEQKKKDSAVFAMISGAVAVPHNAKELTVAAAAGNRGSNSSLASDSSSSEKDSGKKDGKNGTKLTPGSTNAQSSYKGSYDKLDTTEIKDLLLCLLYVLRHLPEDILLGWFNNSSENDIIDFFSLLELCIKHFQYQGRKKIVTLSMIGGQKASTMPSSLQNQRGRPVSLSSQRTPSQYGDLLPDGFMAHTPTASDADAIHRALQEANISTEVGLVVLDVLSLFCSTFKKDLEARGGDNHMMQTVFHIYLNFLRSSQSETLQKHVFGAWRAFIKKFQTALFRGSAEMCGQLCYEILCCCNSKLNSTRREACALLYLLMRSNFEFSTRKSFTRVDLQVIISVSQIVGVVVGLSTSRFQESLAIVNNYASSDKSIQKTPFPGEVRDLTKRIRTVLMATAQMKENENDPELLADLQYSLAQSYASTPALRKTWLEAMAKLHMNRGNYSEAGHCYIHIAALIAEYLKRRGSYPQGCSSFSSISPNIVMEEAGIKDDSGMQDVHYTEETLVEFLEKGAEQLEKAQRFEVLGDIYRLIIPIYEKMRNYQRLEKSYQYLSSAYRSVLEVMKSGKRLLGSYYMVTLYGQTFFEDDEVKEYIYREPNVTPLAEIRERLHKLFSEKFGRENVQMINDSKKLSPNDLDPKYASIQVVYVTPYFDEKELAGRVTDFERNNNVRRFMYELPFTRSGKERGSIEEQHKRRFIITTTHSFPYVKKRIDVKEGGRKEIVLTPIEVAIDEMQVKINDLREVIKSPVQDMKRLQLMLQGGVSAQVNAGPLAYAEAFLNPEKISKYPADKSDRLKTVFKDFVSACKDGLDLNAKLITTEQKEYHESLKDGFLEIAERLSVIFGEKIAQCEWNMSQQRQSMTFLSGGSTGSSMA